jgi:membrane-bound lytic murein transglycosylase B
MSLKNLIDAGDSSESRWERKEQLLKNVLGLNNITGKRRACEAVNMFRGSFYSYLDRRISPKRPIARTFRIAVKLAILLVLVAIGHSPGATKPSFQVWLADVRKEALSIGVSEETLNSAFRDLRPIPMVIERDRSQPEFKLTLDEYLNRVVTERTIREGRKKLHEHRDLLTRISKQYGVQSEFVVALWGIETRYGQRTGSFPVLAAVATLAYDGRRSKYFRREFLNALKILDDGHVSRENMNGSWAGAMGQVQFMPSSFQSYAVDYDGDGRIDIWNNVGDALASAANYLARSGWEGDQGWGREIQLPMGFNKKFINSRISKSLSEWHRIGVSGKGFPQNPNLQAFIVQPDGEVGRTFLTYPNYRVILKWNRSNFFAVAVGTLADRIAMP